MIVRCGNGLKAQKRPDPGRAGSAAWTHLRKRRGAKKRGSLGAAISEFGPALFLMFFFAIFPVLDMIVAGYNYCSCVALNDLQLREASKLPRSQADAANGPVKLIIPQRWASSIIGGFSGTSQLPETVVSYSAKHGTCYVTVSTTCEINPFLKIPFFFGVPGIGAPLITKISNKRVMETPLNYLR